MELAIHDRTRGRPSLAGGIIKQVACPVNLLICIGKLKVRSILPF